MSLRVVGVPPSRGVAWVRDSFRAFFRHPLGFSMMFLLFVVAALVLMVLPVIGPLLLLAFMPLLTLGFAAAARAGQRGEPVHAGLLFEPFRAGDRERRIALLRLCLVYAVVTALVLLLAQTIDGGAFERLQVLMAAERSEANQREVAAALADPALFNGMLARVVLLGAIALPFWHAPMLVWWHGQPLAQSLFSSALACWRNKGAFAVYMLTWLAASGAVGLLASLLVGAFGAQQLTGLLLPPVALLLSVTFYVSLYFVYADSFSD